MNKRELKKALKENLTPLYNVAEKARVDYTINKASNIWELKEALFVIRMLPENKYSMSEESKPTIEELNKKLYGEEHTVYDKFSKRNRIIREGGLITALTDKEYKLIMDKRFKAKQITAYFKAEFKENLKEVIDAIYTSINGFKPTAINLMAHTDYDLNFVLEFKNHEPRSYTIKTIQAGGYNIQCLHLRTNHKLHKKVVS